MQRGPKAPSRFSHPAARRFQSSSGQKAGCNLAEGQDATAASPRSVSILIRPEGRMQPLSEPEKRTYFEFQSSSGQKAGCNPQQRDPQQPARVSILIRPEGRMQPARRGPASSCGFQSSSGQKAGCNGARRHLLRLAAYRFNPHPARRPDATMAYFQFPMDYLLVSILIRPEGRMQHGVSGWKPPMTSFNPHPARRPDATDDSLFSPSMVVTFQSSSGQKAGCNIDFFRDEMHAGGFQSSSGQKAGCNWRHLGRFQGPFQSSSGQKAGCNGRAAFHPRRRGTCFNPHPARRP